MTSRKFKFVKLWDWLAYSESIFSIFRKRKMKKGPSPKISLLVQVGEDMSTGLL